MQQVGYGYGPSTNYSLMRCSGAERPGVRSNYTPADSLRQGALGTNGTQQVGQGGTATGISWALLWSGTAESAVNLNPSGFSNSVARGISGTQQAGYGCGTATGNQYHALLWSGTAESVVDLNPSVLSESYAYGANGTQQVGYGNGTATGGKVHASSGAARRAAWSI